MACCCGLNRQAPQQTAQQPQLYPIDDSLAILTDLKKTSKWVDLEPTRLPGMALLASVGDPAENQSVVLTAMEWCGHDGCCVVTCARSDDIDVAGNEGIPVVIAID